VPDSSEKTRALSPLSYPPSIKFGHQSEKAEKQKQAAGNLARGVAG
jgi:hypothetical protein